MVVLNILIFLIVLSIIVAVHELGHFLMAKRAGILCFEFAIGMGPTVYSKKKGETVYSFRAIPMGGFVSMAGEQVETSIVKPEETISIELDDEGFVVKIAIDETIELPIKGVVKEVDLYDVDNQKLYITLLIDDEEKEFLVRPNALYVYNKKQERQIAPANRCFETKSIWARFLAIFAGPLMNFLFALNILFLVALIQGAPVNENIVNNSDIFERGDQVVSIAGVTTNDFGDIQRALINNNEEYINIVINRDNQRIEKNNVQVRIIIQTLGITNDGIENSRGQVVVGDAIGRASRAGLRRYDVITGIRFGSNDNPIVPITNWNSLLVFLRTNEDSDVTLRVEREGVAEPVMINFTAHLSQTFYDLGSVPMLTMIDVAPNREFRFSYVLSYPFLQFGRDASQMFVTLGMLFNPNSTIGIGDLSGPVGIFNLVSNAASQGFVTLLAFAAFLSINVGILNLLPFPALDGGRLIFLGVEGVTKKKVSVKVENIVNMIGFFLLIGLMLFVTFNDVLGLF